MLGHFPAPWGNELKAGPLEALLALCFSLVMFLSMTGGAEDLRRDLPRSGGAGYCLLMQLLYAAPAGHGVYQRPVYRVCIH